MNFQVRRSLVVVGYAWLGRPPAASCHFRARCGLARLGCFGLAQGCASRLVDRIGEGPLTLAGRVEVDQRGPGDAVAHPLHQLAEVGASIGRERISGMPQVVKVNGWQASRLERGEPKAAPEVAVPQRRAGGGREDGRAGILLAELGQVPADSRHDEVRDRHRADTDSFRERRLARRDSQTTGAEGEEEGEVEGRWKDQLIARLMQLPPDGFERLAQRILREAGFVNVTVTGKSGDGGIDGVGTYRLSLVSFPVYFQCKRYKGAVTPGAVRDFRGAMAGRGEKGLLITTGSFTRDAQAEATRDGAPPVELIDGDRLCGLLKEFRPGIEIRQRIEEDVTVNPSFFDEYQ